MSPQALQIPSACTLLCGDDAISMENARTTKIAQLTAAYPGLAILRFDPAVQKLGQFLDQMMTVSLFAEPRAFVLRHAESLDAKESAALATALDYPLSDAWLFIESTDIPGAAAKPAKTTKTAKPKAIAWPNLFKLRMQEQPARYSITEFIKPRDYEMAPWVVDRARQFLSRQISPADAAHLVDTVGPEPVSLFSELQKIDLILPAGDPITKKIIDAVCEAAREITPFELAESLGKKDSERTMVILDGLFRQNFYAPTCIAALFRHFFALLRIRSYADSHKAEMKAYLEAVGNFSKKHISDEIGLAIGVAAGILTETQRNRVYPAIIKSGIVSATRNFSASSLISILEMLYEFDIQTKRGQLDPNRSSMELLCYKILRSKEIEATYFKEQ